MRSVELGQSVSYYIQENIWISAQGSRVCGSHLCCISIEYQTTFSAFWIIKLNSLGLPYGLLLKYFQTLAAVLFLKERFLFPPQALLVQKMLVAKAKYINLPNISWVLRRAEKWTDKEKQLHFEIGFFLMSHANVCSRQKQLVPPGSAAQNRGCRSFQKPWAALTKEDHTGSSHSQKDPGRLFDYYLQGSLASNVGNKYRRNLFCA